MQSSPLKHLDAERLEKERQAERLEIECWTTCYVKSGADWRIRNLQQLPAAEHVKASQTRKAFSRSQSIASLWLPAKSRCKLLDVQSLSQRT